MVLKAMMTSRWTCHYCSLSAGGRGGSGATGHRCDSDLKAACAASGSACSPSLLPEYYVRPCGLSPQSPPQAC